MDSDSEQESIEGEVAVKAPSSDWGKAKHDYYYTDYVDKDYPSKLTAKEERLAAIEQEEALRLQKKLLATLVNVDLQVAYDEDSAPEDDQENLIDLIERQNRTLDQNVVDKSKKRKRVQFDSKCKSDEEEFDDEDIDASDDDDEDDEDEDDDDDDDELEEGAHNGKVKKVELGEDGDRKRRPINAAMKHNRGLTPYKKKEYRNPRVKHKMKFKRAMSKRRRNVKEAQIEYHRYSGEATGIKTSTVKSIKLC